MVGVLFTPTAGGALTGTLTLTDNALNVSGATQQIAFSGTGQSSTTTTSVPVGTSSAGLSFSVDGTSYTTSQTLTWNVGDSHTIATASPQTSGGIQNTFASWSDCGALSHSVTASASTELHGNVQHHIPVDHRGKSVGWRDDHASFGIVLRIGHGSEPSSRAKLGLCVQQLDGQRGERQQRFDDRHHERTAERDRELLRGFQRHLRMGLDGRKQHR
jgi:hypothetical protein